jgi:tRNA threonylcarbamoyladenosine biosynthesis protein TsaE
MIVPERAIGPPGRIIGRDRRNVIRTASAEETRALGRRLGELLRPGDLVTLAGPFGAGKTTLVQGIGDGLGIREQVTSPSFALVNEYLPADSGARLPFFHFDLYRLDGAADALDLGLDDYLDRPAAVAIEWPEAAAPALPVDRLDLALALDGEARTIALLAGGPRSSALRDALTGGGQVGSTGC